MTEKLFEIKCTTCEKNFPVTDPELIGQIIACPVCGGMIYITPPFGYKSGKENAEDYTIPLASDSYPTAAEKSASPIENKTENKPSKSFSVNAESSEPPMIKSNTDSSEPPMIKTDTDSSESPMIKSDTKSNEPPMIKTNTDSSEPPMIKTDTDSNEPPMIKPDTDSSEPPMIKPDTDSSEPPMIKPDTDSSEPPMIKTDTDSNEPPMIKTNTDSSEPPMIKPDTKSSESPMIKPNTDSNEPPMIKSDTDSSEPPMIKSDTDSSEPPMIKPDADSSEPPMIKPDADSSEPPMIKPNTDSNEPPMIKPNTDSSEPPMIKSDTDSSEPPMIKPDADSSEPPMIKPDTDSSEPPMLTGNGKADKSSKGPKKSKGSKEGVSNIPPREPQHHLSLQSEKGQSVFQNIYLWLLLAIVFILMAIFAVLFFTRNDNSGDLDNNEGVKTQQDPASRPEGIPEHTTSQKNGDSAQTTSESAKANTGTSLNENITNGKSGEKTSSDSAVSSEDLSQKNIPDEMDGAKDFPAIGQTTPDQKEEPIDQELMKEDLRPQTNSSDNNSSSEKSSTSPTDPKTTEGTSANGTATGLSSANQPSSAATSNNKTLPENTSSPNGKAPNSEDSKKEANDVDPEDEFASTAMTTRTSFQSFLPTLQKEESKLDIPERLKAPFNQLSYTSEQLSGLVQIFSGISGVPISLDLDYIDILRPLFKKSPNLEIRNGTAGEALKKMAELLKMKVQINSDGILLTVPDSDKAMTVVEYDLADLEAKTAQDAEKSNLPPLPKDETFLPVKLNASDVSPLVTRLIDPTTWTTSEGKGEIKTVQEQKISIHQNINTQTKIRRFIEQIRMIRGLEPNKNLSTEETIPETLCWEKLQETITLNYLDPTPLIEVMSAIAQTKKIQIFIDEASLKAVGVQVSSPVKVRFDNAPIEQILSALLNPLQLSYLILADNAIMITSLNRALSYITVEIHLFALPDGKQLTAEELKSLPDRIRKEIAPESWAKSVKGPQMDNPEGILCIDAFSRCVLVRQSQPIQRQISQWFKRNISDRERNILPGSNPKPETKASP